MVILIRLKFFYNNLIVVLILAPGREFYELNLSNSFNIYGLKLNTVHFFSGTVITHFLDKLYQEINFKSHLNSHLSQTLVNKKKYCQICTSHIILSHFIGLCPLFQ